MNNTSNLAQNPNQRNLSPSFQENSEKSRKVTLSVGGLKAGYRQDKIPKTGSTFPVTSSTNYNNNRPSVNSGMGAPLASRLPINNQHYSSHISQPYNAQPIQYDNSPNYNNNSSNYGKAGLVGAGVGAGLAGVGMNTYASQQNEYYNNNNQYQVGSNQYSNQYDNQNQGMMVRGREETHYEEDSEYGNKQKVKSKKNKKSCKDKLCGCKCCGPLLWALLGLLALAALTIGLLFAFGVLGKHNPPSDPMLTINGVEYPSDSVTVRTQVVESYEDSKTDYRFPPQDEKIETKPTPVYGQIDPIPVQPVSPTYVRPVVVQPIRPTSNTQNVPYPYPSLPASKIISPKSTYVEVDPIATTPTRSLNIQDSSDEVNPISWVPDTKNTGYYIPQTEVSQ